MYPEKMSYGVVAEATEGTVSSKAYLSYHKVVEDSHYTDRNQLVPHSDLELSFQGQTQTEFLVSAMAMTL